MIRQPDQIIQRQSLGEFCGTYHLLEPISALEIAPVFHLLEVCFISAISVGAADYLHHPV